MNWGMFYFAHKTPCNEFQIVIRLKVFFYIKSLAGEKMNVTLRFGSYTFTFTQSSTFTPEPSACFMGFDATVL